MDDQDYSVTDHRLPKPNKRAIPKALQLMVFQRDLWLCCTCRRPVIFSPALKLLEADVQHDTGLNKLRPAGELAYYHRNGAKNRAPLLDLLAASIDHIIAFASGGGSSEKNLRTLCFKCNVRKGILTEDQWNQQRVRKPVRRGQGEPLYWDGLASVFVMLADRDQSRLTAGEKDWLSAMKASYAIAKVEPKPASSTPSNRT